MTITGTEPDSANARGLSVGNLTPGYFASVMATGIISIGAELKGLTALAIVLFWLAVGLHVLLMGLNVWRFVAQRSRMAEDFHNPSRGFGFFTFIAAINVLAAALVATGYQTIAFVLLIVSGITWLALGYIIPWTAVLGSSHRPMLDTANGTWFIWAVASQSVAVVAAGLEPLIPSLRNELAILAVAAWSIGLVLYAATALFVMLRVMLYSFEPEQFDPPYWVAMGALAISVVAGARLVEMDNAPMVDVTRDLAAGTSVVLWCFATWLIPVLFAVGVWRHVYHRIPLRYLPTLWSMVFPLGMYSVAGIYLGEADGLPVVSWIGAQWFWVALLAWLLTFAGMVADLIGRIRFVRRSELHA